MRPAKSLSLNPSAECTAQIALWVTTFNNAKTVNKQHEYCDKKIQMTKFVSGWTKSDAKSWIADVKHAWPTDHDIE